MPVLSQYHRDCYAEVTAFQWPEVLLFLHLGAQFTQSQLFCMCLPSVCLPHCLSALMRSVPEAIQGVANADVAVWNVEHFFTVGRSENGYSHYRN